MAARMNKEWKGLKPLTIIDKETAGGLLHRLGKGTAIMKKDNSDHTYRPVAENDPVTLNASYRVINVVSTLEGGLMASCLMAYGLTASVYFRSACPNATPLQSRARA